MCGGGTILLFSTLNLKIKVDKKNKGLPICISNYIPFHGRCPASNWT